MAELIKPTDTLAQGYPKINAAIEQAEQAFTTADNAMDTANSSIAVSNQALANSQSTQEQLNQIVIDGDSSVEAAQARVNADNTITYDTLKERLDAEHQEVSSQLADITNRLQEVNYEMFRQPNLTDDEVIRNAHLYANEHNIRVVNLSGEYFLNTPSEIPIYNDVEWGNTIFHIDESKGNKNHFIIKSSIEREEIVLSPTDKATLLSQINEGKGVVNFLKPYKNNLIKIENSTEIEAHRYNANGDSQSWIKSECFYVTEDGEIVGNIINNFNDITKLTKFFGEENYLTVTGGVFLLNGIPPIDTTGEYILNGIGIERSKTVIKNMFIDLESGDIDMFPSSLNMRIGFFNYTNLYDLTFKNIKNIPLNKSADGTYGFNGSNIVKLTFDTVQGKGMINKWGIVGQNKIKLMVVRDCELNRIDVHYNCRGLLIENSVIDILSLNGGGNLTINNSIIKSNDMIFLRDDYGGSWDGDINIENVTLIPNLESTSVHIIHAPTVGFDFGFNIVKGREINIKNVIVDFKNTPNFNQGCYLVRLFGEGVYQYNGKRTSVFEKLSAKNVHIRNVNDVNIGFRFIELISPHFMQTRKEGEFIKGIVDMDIKNNVVMEFDDVDTEKRKSYVDAKSISSIYMKPDTSDEGYVSNSAIPKIIINNCSDLKIKLYDSVADVTIMNSVIDQYIGDSELYGSRSKVAFINCELKPYAMSNTSEPTKDDLNYIRTSHDTKLISCTIHPVRFNNVINYGSRIKQVGTVYYDTANKGLIKNVNVRSVSGCKFSSDFENHIRTVFSEELANEYNKLLNKFSIGIDRLFIEKGTTEQRPIITNINNTGHMYYDTTLKTPIWWNGTEWVDTTGVTV